MFTCKVNFQNLCESPYMNTSSDQHLSIANIMDLLIGNFKEIGSNINIIIIIINYNKYSVKFKEIINEK
jgi:hypothetical protein